MSDTEDLTAFYGLPMKPKLKSEEERIAKLREYEKRKRIEKLHSYPVPGRSQSRLCSQ